MNDGMIMMVKMIVMMMVIMMILIIMMIMIVMRMRMIMITSDFGLLNRHRPQPAISARQSVIILTISGRSNSIGFSARLTSFRHFASSGSCWRSSEIWEHSLHADMVS